MPLKQIEGVGSAALYRGDPRMATSDIDEWYQEILTHVSEPKARMHLWGADAGLCARRNVLLEHNESISAVTTASSNAYMSIGVALEDMLARGLREKGRLLVQGMYLIEIPQVKIRGKIDLIVVDHLEQLALVEVKTCGKLPTAPNPTHLAQIQTYAAISGIRHCWLTYISRNVATEPWGPGVAMRTFAVDTTDAPLQNRLHIALTSRLASNLHRLPPVPSTFRKHTECHYCEFRDSMCWLPRPGLRVDSKESDIDSDSLESEYVLEKYYLPELSIEEYVNIDKEALKISTLLMDSILFRKKETLEKLMDLPLSDLLVTKVKEEYVTTMDSILS